MGTRLVRQLPALVLFLVCASNAFAESAGQQLVLDPKIGLNAYATLVDKEFDSIRGGLRILSVTENLISGDWDRIKGPLAQFSKGQPISAAVWFARTDGSYFTVEAGLTDKNLKERDYFPRLMAGQEVIGDLVVSLSTGQRSAVVAVPVKAEGKVIGAVGASVAMEKVAALIDEKIGFPPQVMFYALDSLAQIALHRMSSLLFEFATELGSPTLAGATKEMMAKPEGTVHYEFSGGQREAIFKKSAVTGWVYALRW